MKSLCVLVMVAVLLSACAPAVPAARPVPNETPDPPVTMPASSPTVPVMIPAVLPAPEATPAVQASSIYTVTDALGYVDTFFVDPGLDDVTPPVGGRVLVRARLFRNGVRFGGIMAHVTWMQAGTLQLCDLLPLYQNGCIIEVRDFTAGVFVPVTVTMRYLALGTVFTGYGGFTPQ